MNGIVSINGEITPIEEAKISVLDRAFLFGDGIFEVVVGFNNKLIALEEHIQRLRYSGESIALSLPWKDKELCKKVLDVYEQTHFSKTYVRIAITRGEGLGIIPNDSAYNTLIYALPAPISPPRIYTEGLSLKTKNKNSSARGASIKNPFYLPSIVEMISLKKENYDDVLWVNNDEEITEASTSNIFFISREGSQIFVETPSLESGLLSGITRNLVLNLLKENGVECRETTILHEEMARFDEAFLTSTIRGLVPIRRIDEKRFETVRPTASFHKISGLFLSWVEKELGSRLDWNTGAAL